MYGFHKTKDNSGMFFQHPDFKSGHRDLLVNLKRKTNNGNSNSNMNPKPESFTTRDITNNVLLSLRLVIPIKSKT